MLVIQSMYMVDLVLAKDLFSNHFYLEKLQHIGEFTYPRLADFGAAISGANKSKCQEVLEELDVSIGVILSSFICRHMY